MSRWDGLTPEQRFEANVDRSGDCHRWTAGHDSKGYGHFWYRGETRGAHQVALMIAGIDIPAGLVVDHVRARGCRHRDCVRVDHLELVSLVENTMRGDNPFAQNGRKSHCNKGHEFTAENTRVTTIGGRRFRACARDENAARRLVERKHMSPPEAARLLGVSPAEVRRRCESGEIEAVRSGRVWRVRIDALLAEAP